jgi:hypothetical protein
MQVESAFPFPASPCSRNTAGLFPRKLKTHCEEFIFALLFFAAFLKRIFGRLELPGSPASQRKTSGKTEDQQIDSASRTRMADERVQSIHWVSLSCCVDSLTDPGTAPESSFLRL